MVRTRALVALSFLLLTSDVARPADMVGGWTDTFCETVKTLIQTAAGPCRTSRSGAMMYLAMYDAVNSITKEREPYAVDYPAPADASTLAAATTAAYEVLMAMYPTRAYLFNPRYEADLATIPDGPEKVAGIEVGQGVAEVILELRSDDGSGDVVVYEPVLEPGHWRPTWPEFRAAKDPGYGRVTPFGLETPDQFPRPAPPPLDSYEYYEAWDEVRRLGGVRANQESTLEYEIGWFWANDQDGTFKPPGHIFAMTKSIAEVAGLDFEDRVHLFALIGIATADAAIAGWHSKYETDLDVWRPITGIREADTDGNPFTESDPDWIPISYVTPNFPGHVSGHATFAGASSQLYRRYFGTDEMTFVVPTSDWHLAPNWTRTMTSFTQAEVENADSRIYIGVHWRFDCDGGLEVGRRIGDWTYENLLRPVDGLVAAVSPTPSPIRLEALYPNPSSGTATLRFAATAAGVLRLSLYDAAGRQVQELGDRTVAAGLVEVDWDGSQGGTRPLAPGVYYVRGTLDGSPLALGSTRSRLVVMR